MLHVVAHVLMAIEALERRCDALYILVTTVAMVAATRMFEVANCWRGLALAMEDQHIPRVINGCAVSVVTRTSQAWLLQNAAQARFWLSIFSSIYLRRH